MIQMENKFKKAKRNFFCFTEYKYVAYSLNQHKQLTNGRNVCGATINYGAIYKVRTLKWPQFFYSESPFYALWEKNDATKPIDYAFGQTSPSLFHLPAYVLYRWNLIWKCQQICLFCAI